MSECEFVRQRTMSRPYEDDLDKISALYECGTHRVHSAKTSFSVICGSEKMEIKLSNSTYILQYYKEILLEPNMKIKKKKTKYIKTL